jgi:ADP-ribosylglycohydrolase
MLGAIAGDIIGSRFELRPTWMRDFTLFDTECRFTDDTVLTVATASALLEEQYYNDRRQHYVEQYHDWFAQYPDAGYGESFYSWADDRKRAPYGSWGNGAAMRVSPVAWAFDTLEETIREAGLSASVTHDNPEGMKGAQAIAAAVFLARTGKIKEEIAKYIGKETGYDLSQPLEEQRRVYRFDVSAAGSVPQAIRCFLESDDYESAVRNAVWLGGDTDTLACMAGSIAEAFYGGVPAPIAVEALTYLEAPLSDVIVRFYESRGIPLPWSD